MLNKIKTFFKNETGAETLEYVVIATVIIVAGAGAYSAANIPDLITSAFTTLTDLMTAPAAE